MRCKVYLSGPMTGKPNFNRQVFAETAARLRDLGFDVVSPPELNPPVLKLNDEDYNWRQYLARDVAMLIAEPFDAVVVLPGWESSRGSVLEVNVARSIGLKVFPLIEILRVSKTLGEK